MEEPSGPLPSVWFIRGEDMVSGRWGSGQNYPLHPQLSLLVEHTRTEDFDEDFAGRRSKT